jgi:hypothetical protein
LDDFLIWLGEAFLKKVIADFIKFGSLQSAFIPKCFSGLSGGDIRGARINAIAMIIDGQNLSSYFPAKKGKA